VSKQADWIDLLGRALLSFMFILSGVMKIPGWDQTLAYMASQGVPWTPIFLAAAIAIEVIVGLAILLGFRTRIAATVMFLYLLPVTLVMHAFWTAPPGESLTQMQHFLKNLTIMGGLLVLAVNGARRFSMDAEVRTRHGAASHHKDRRLRAA
jgi:putative oxidoreductase